MEADKFLVWNPRKGYPTTHHQKFDAAVTESERLAKLHPGQRFYVMAPIGSSLVEEPKIFSRNDKWHHLPF